MVIVAKKDHAGKRPEGTDRLAEGESGQGIAGDHRRRRRIACRRQSSSRSKPARAFSSCLIAASLRRCRIWWPGKIDMMIDQPANFAAAGACRHHQGLCRHGQDPLGSSARYPDGGRGGLPGFHVSNWTALWAPKGTPKDVIAKLNAAVVDALADPTVRARLADLGQEIPRASSRRRRRSRAYPKGRDREVVADHQGGGHQSRMRIGWLKHRRAR